MTRARRWILAACFLLVVAGLARYRPDIRAAAVVLTDLAVLAAAIVLLLAASGRPLAGLRRRAVRLARATARTSLTAQLRAALADIPSGPGSCAGGCGRTAERRDIAEEGDGTGGRRAASASGLCPECAGRLADAARPYDPLPPAADNRPPVPDPAFDKFADAHQELQP